MLRFFILLNMLFAGLALRSHIQRQCGSVIKNASRSTATRRNVATLTEPVVSTKRVVLSPLPKVYVYDHCPFCVRARLALGLKGVKHEVVFMLNDDVDTPTALVGKKIAPIFEMAGSIQPMAESLDIVEKVDTDPQFGPVNFFKPFSSRTDLKEWQKKVATTNRFLQRPRYMMTYLPEFATADGKNAFVYNHAIAPYSKDEWKEKSNEERWQLMNEAYEKSLTMIDSTNEALQELDQLIYSTESCTEGGLSYDDIDLWARLRSLTMVKGLVFPEKLRGYLDNLAEKGDVPLYWSIQC